MIARLGKWTAIAALAILAGCATYAQKTGAFRTSLADRDYDSALKTLKGARKGPDRLLYLLESGLVAHYQGQYQTSNTWFDDAERLADQLYTRSLSREAAALLTNDAVRAYRGEEFELVFIHYYRALNYWYLGLPEDALVECRKANLRLAGHAAEADFDPTYRNDAFIQYMTGLFYEATGELNDAYVSYRDAEKAYQTYQKAFGLPAPPALSADLHRVDGELNGTGLTALRFASLGLPGAARASGNGDLVLFAEVGFIPRKIQEEIDLPIFDDDLKHAGPDELDARSRIIAARYRHRVRWESPNVDYWLRVALPAYQASPTAAARVVLSASGKTADAVPAENLAAIARVTFQDEQPTILARTTARALVKYMATREARKKNRILGFFANLLAASTEVADTRSWVSLPHTVEIGRLSLPPGSHELTVETRDAAGRVIDRKVFPNVVIRPGERTFLNYRTYR